MTFFVFKVDKTVLTVHFNTCMKEEVIFTGLCVMLNPFNGGTHYNQLQIRMKGCRQDFFIHFIYLMLKKRQNQKVFNQMTIT